MMKIALTLPAILALAALAAGAGAHIPLVHRSPAPISHPVRQVARGILHTPTPSFTFEQLFQLQKKFLNAFIYPENQVLVSSN